MKKKILLTICLLFLSGCATELTPRQRLQVTQDTFNVTVDTLNILNEAGKFDAKDQEKITLALETGDKLMTKWEDAVMAEKQPPDIIDNIHIIIGELLTYKLKGQSNE